MNDEWSINWAGELVFFSNDEIIKAVLPKKNTAVIFPSHMIHVARSVSRICYQVRRTLMFKFKNKNI
jgi:Rps23 Pro-64 3,4-dihydroxylase Tpa1-like proline 4-hydroxylase